MKRIVCFLLAMFLVLGLAPMTAINANAASNWSTSETAIDSILTKPDRFEEKAYGGGFIGYGTKVAADDAAANALYPDGISEEKAEQVLRDYLKNVIDPAIKKALPGVSLTQQQHDALVMFCMEMNDTSWLNDSTHPLREAVRTGKTGNDFLNAIAKVGISNPANNETLRIKMNLRLAIANLYLNGDYAYKCPSNFTYVVLEKNGTGTEVVAYDSSKGYTLGKDAPEANFLGWFRTDKIDTKTNTITQYGYNKLDASTARLTLKSVFDTQGYKFDYITSTNNLLSRYVFTKALSKSEYATNMDAKSLETLEKNGKLLKGGTDFKVTDMKMADGIRWLKGTGTNTEGKSVTGWVYVGAIAEAGTSTEKVLATATMKKNVDIHEGALSSSGKIGTIAKDTTVNIYAYAEEKTDKGNVEWGKVNYNGIIGWIKIDNTEVTENTGINNSPNGRKGKIVNAEEVNIRSNPGITATNKITSLKKGTEVTVLQTRNVGTAQWGEIKWSGLKDGYTQGWVYMYYVETEGLEQSESGNAPGTVKYTGVVTSNINLNVREKPDIYAAQVGSLPKGTKVNVYDITVSKNMKWGRIGTDRWVCLSYVSLTEVTSSSTGSSSTTTTQQATVTANTLDIFQNYNNNSSKIGTLKKGDVLTILERNTETTATGSRIWGRIIKDGVEGWINLAYVELKTVTSVTGGTTTGSTGVTSNSNGAEGVVSNCISVNVRKGAGVGSEFIIKLKSGTPVQVYERVTKDGAPWARITWNNGASEGWVCMNYVTMKSVAGTTENGGTIGGTNSNTISATGTVNSNINLRVRSGAGLGYAELGSLAKGTKVTVYEQVSSDNMIWGRINYNNASGWICMSYITVDSVSSTGKGVMGTIARCFNAVNVRSAPGTGNARVATIGVGNRVEVFETREYAGQLWGRVAQGWICMDYVLLDSELPPGTALDATQPTEAPTQPPVSQEPVNRDNEVLYTISGDLNVAEVTIYNDASDSSDRVGTLKAPITLNILAVKNNGAELWGRIDQYATAGWINMKNVNYSVKGYINTDAQPVYADPSVGSTVKGKLDINTYFEYKKLTVSGDTIFGWFENATLAGWIPMGRVSANKVDVIPTYKTTETITANDVKGYAGVTLSAYSEVGGSKVSFYLASGTEIKIGMICLDNGIAWAQVKVLDVDGNLVEGWVNLKSVAYSIFCAVSDKTLKVYKDKYSETEANELGTLNQGDGVSISEISFDNNGDLWGQVAAHGNAILNGGYIRMSGVQHALYILVK